MIEVKNGWEFGKICLNIVDGITSRFTKISSRGKIEGTVYMDLSLLEAKELVKELQKIVNEFEKCNHQCQTDYNNSLKLDKDKLDELCEDCPLGNF